MRFEATMQRLCVAGDALEDTDDYDNAFAAFELLLHRAIREARSGRQLGCLFSLGVLEQATFGEGYHDDATMRVLWGRVLRFENPRNLATGIAIATYCCDPIPSPSGDISAANREGRLATLIERRAQLWSLTHATSPRVRAAACLAVARLPDLERLHHEEMEAGIASESTPVALGARILATAIASRRSPARSPRLSSYLAHPDKLVRVAAAVAIAISSGKVDELLLPALTEAVVQPESVPLEWCALRPRDPGTSEPRPLPGDWCLRAATPETTAYLVIALLSRIEFEGQPTAALLGGMVKSGARNRDVAGLTALRLAFPRPPAAGIAASELSPLQSSVLEALAASTSPRSGCGPALGRALSKLGMVGLEDIPRWLEGTDPRFRPLPIRVGDTERLWHLGRVWRSMLLSEVSVEDACTAALNLRNDELLPALLLQRDALELTIHGRRGSEWGERRAAALVSLVERLVARGADVLGYVVANAGSSSMADAALAALVAAAVQRLEVPATLDGLLADALFDDSLRDEVLSRMRSMLPGARVDEIVDTHARQKVSYDN
jgi:hypothetical protein